MPKINPGESRKSYIPRCINYVMKNEGLSEKAAAGKCEGMYDQYEKNKRKHKKTKSNEIVEEAMENYIEKNKNNG